MNNPDDFPIDAKAERAWLQELKNSTGMSWSALAAESGIPHGTLTTWASSTVVYAGNDANVARRVFRFRQQRESQADHAALAAPSIVDAGFINLPTARRLRTLMIVAQSGKMTVGATGSGTGKSETAQDYAASVSNTWLVTISQTTRSLAAMMGLVVKAVGGKTANGWTRQMSAEVIDRVRNRKGLLIFDEANHLDFEALEEIRHWHDMTKVGVCLLGNEELLATIRNGNARHGSHAWARLNSRIAMSHVQDLPLDEDIDLYLEARGVRSADQRTFLRRVALTPGSGGLREISQIVENGSMLAAEDGVEMTQAHLREAMATRATKHLRLAS